MNGKEKEDKIPVANWSLLPQKNEYNADTVNMLKKFRINVIFRTTKRKRLELAIGSTEIIRPNAEPETNNRY